MKIKFSTLLVLLFAICTPLISQSGADLSQKVLQGIVELRNDILTRKQNYLLDIRNILVEIDTSDLGPEKKQFLTACIKTDFTKGITAISSIDFDQLPKNSPFKSPQTEKYVRISEDYSIDVGLIKELKARGLFKGDALKIADISPLIKELELMNIQESDHILHAHAATGIFDMLIGYIYQEIELTVHNRFIDLHYITLDRMDRYPNVNNGNVIEFRNIDKIAIKLEGEQWDKIIIRDAMFFENELNIVLKSIHDNLKPNGRVFVKTNTKTEKCKSGTKKEKLIKGLQKLDYQIIDSIDDKCQTIFKLKSVKEN